MDDKLTMTPTEALLKEAQALERAAAIYAEIARRGGASTSVAVVGTGSAGAQIAAEIAKLPLTDAVVLDLRQSKKPKTPQQIWRSLEAAGYEAHSDTPEESVKWALKKLVMRGDPDIVHIGWNTWHLRSKYSKAKLERLIKSRAGKGGRTTDEHVARTLAGMEKAKSRGKLGHRPSKVTTEIATKLKQAMLEGATQAEIAAAGGISLSGYLYYKKRLEVWNIGEPWPPREILAGNPVQLRPLISLVKS